jgi:hypothetical protein
MSDWWAREAQAQPGEIAGMGVGTEPPYRRSIAPLGLKT